MPIEKVLTKKSLGVLMHPSCIPGGRVCGTFGRGAKEWAVGVSLALPLELGPCHEIEGRDDAPL